MQSVIYRGVTDGVGGRWRMPPKASRFLSVLKWVYSIDPAATRVKQIVDGFTTFAEMDQWLDELRKKPVIYATRTT